MRQILSLAALALLLVSPVARADQSRDEALRLARKLTTAGAATFDTKDARAMVTYYTADAHLFIICKEKETPGIDTEVKRGRAEIEEFYRSVFQDAGRSSRGTRWTSPA